MDYSSRSADSVLALSSVERAVILGDDPKGHDPARLSTFNSLKEPLEPQLVRAGRPLRDRLLADVRNIAAAELAVSWAREALAAKNKLAAPDVWRTPWNRGCRSSRR